MMLSKLSIKRPIFITMIMSGLLIFGLLSLSRLGIDLYPQVDFPIITVHTLLPGGDPTTIETTVSKPIEDALSTISSIKHIYSTSTENISQVVIEFDLEKNIDIAYQEVLAKIGTAKDKLPDDIEEPIVEKADLSASPILALVVSGDLPIQDLSYIADKTIKERLQSIPGIGRISVIGKRERTIWLLLNPQKLEGLHLSALDVLSALKSHHLDLPGGLLPSGAIEFALKTKGEFLNVNDFNHLVITYKNGAPIYLSDIGEVKDGLEEERSLARVNDKKALTLLVRKQSGMNTMNIVQHVKKAVVSLQEELKGQNITLSIAQDFSVFIDQSIHKLLWHLVFGGALAVLVVLLFLHSAKMTIIGALTLPLSVFATFILMYALGFTMNTMTMLALSLAIGILIDDAIVVIENIHRHFKNSSSPTKAAEEGTSEIGLAAFAITMSIVAVFLPVAFMKGIIGRFFYQFGMTVAFSVLMSLFIAFTLTPMLSAKFLKPKEKTNRLSLIIEEWLQKINRGYTHLLQQALHNKKTTLIIALSSLILSFVSFHWIETEFVPPKDQSEFYVYVKAPLGSTLQATDELISPLRKEIEKQPWAVYTLTTIGTGSLEKVHEATLYVKMVEKNQRPISQSTAMNQVRDIAKRFPTLTTSVGPVQEISGGKGKNAALQIALEGSNLDKLESLSKELLEHLQKSSGYVDQEISFENDKPELSILIKRDRAAALGVTIQNIAETIKLLMGGKDVSKFTSDGERYNITIRLEECFRTKEQLYSLSVANKAGDLISLHNLIEVIETKGPVQIDRTDRRRTITVLSNLVEGKKTLGEAVTETSQFLHTMKLPPGYSYRFAGNAEAMQESFGYLLLALGLAVALVYMILASQFESFLYPLTIMLSLPFALVGAFFGLLITNLTLNIFSCIGLIMLIGLVTKNAILLVDYTNTIRKKENLSVHDALIKAGSTRLAPILMTTLSMIFGMLPSALSRGAGSESSAPMAIVVIGGLLSSMFLTLLIVPVVYAYIESCKARLLRHQSR